MKNNGFSLVIRQLEDLRCCFNSFFYRKKHEKKENDRKTQLAKDNLLPSMAFPVELICVLQRITTNTFLVRNLGEDKILKIMSSLSVRHQAFPGFTCFFVVFFFNQTARKVTYHISHWCHEKVAKDEVALCFWRRSILSFLGIVWQHKEAVSCVQMHLKGSPSEGGKSELEWELELVEGLPAWPAGHVVGRKTELLSTEKQLKCVQILKENKVHFKYNKALLTLAASVRTCEEWEF